MGRLEIEFSKKAAKQYRHLPQDYKTLVDAALKKFCEGLPTDLKPIQGEKDVYRVRVGRYRILFKTRESTLLIAKIGTRGGIYK
jgi:mRNA interferase RelE/StbE